MRTPGSLVDDRIQLRWSQVWPGSDVAHDVAPVTMLLGSIGENFDDQRGVGEGDLEGAAAPDAAATGRDHGGPRVAAGRQEENRDLGRLAVAEGGCPARDDEPAVPIRDGEDQSVGPLEGPRD